MDPKDFLPHFAVSRGGIKFPVPLPFQRNDIVVYTSYEGDKSVGVVTGRGDGWLQDMILVQFYYALGLDPVGVNPERLELIGSLTQLGVSLDG
jgi:hypothetical protein